MNNHNKLMLNPPNYSWEGFLREMFSIKIPTNKAENFNLAGRFVFSV